VIVKRMARGVRIVWIEEDIVGENVDGKI